MKHTRIAYYCVYTKYNDRLPIRSPAFITEKAARVEAVKLVKQGYWGAVEKHREWKEDYSDDTAWLPDGEDAGEQAIEMLEYF